MPKITVKPDENGRIVIGDLCAIHVDAIAALEVASPNDAAVAASTFNKTGAVKVAEHHLSLLAPVAQHDKYANYDIKVVITRQPVTDGENVAILTKTEASKTARAEKAAKEAAAVKDRITIVQDAERAAADRIAERDAAVLEKTIKVLTANR